MRKTIFSKIIDREIPAYILWDDEHACAFLDIKPIAPGHTLLVPVTPEPAYLFDMKSDAYTALWDRARWLAKHIQAAMGCKRVGIMVEGFMVPHVHIHLIPINNGHDLNPNGAQPMEQSLLQQYHKKIMQQVSRKKYEGFGDSGDST